MTTGVDLSEFDWKGMEDRAAEHERALYRKVVDDEDTVAAARLIALYASCTSLSAPEVQEALDEGVREVLLAVAMKSANPGAPANIKPLNFFGLEGTTGPNAEKSKAMIEFRRAMEIPLSEQDARIALTKEYEQEGKGRTRALKNLKPVDREDWPETVGDVEIALIDYVRKRLFKMVDEEVSRTYVRESFPWMPWDRREEPVIYPARWELHVQ